MSSQKYYVDAPKNYVAVDCVIFGYEDYELKLLLHPRPVEPEKGKWALMGGFCGVDESLEQAAERVLEINTGLADIFLDQVHAFSLPQRDSGGRVISMVFYALIPLFQQDVERVNAKGAKWFPISNFPSLVFDHSQMVENALKKLQMRASYHLVGRELLPDQFTLMQLRRLYEAIFQQELDPGNFRKKVLSLKVLERLNKKNTTESKKGAYLYKFIPKAAAGTERILNMGITI
ncbi:NUDIX domain-containing protein [Marinilabiliaceae bacterium ANBcel2]|nr:NUDIX domain-containing protein [Marinilabiliaceae bacterium ANBcel2]